MKADAMDTLGRAEGGQEVRITPGKCVTWHCYNDVQDWPEHRECEQHRAEVLPVIDPDKNKRKAAADRLRYQTDPDWAQRRRDRHRESTRRRRLDPAVREKAAQQKREKRAAAKAA